MRPLTKGIRQQEEETMTLSPSTRQDGDRPATESTETQLIRLSQRLGVPIRGDLSEREARRRIIMLREAENA